MSQAIVNPAELRRFIHNLQRFNNELQTQMTMLRGQLTALGQTWRDQEHEKFVQEFQETLLVVNRFVEATNQHVPQLLRKAERVEEYLNQR
jgi:WXG100 family type VII secretion target